MKFIALSFAATLVLTTGGVAAALCGVGRVIRGAAHRGDGPFQRVENVAHPDRLGRTAQLIAAVRAARAADGRTGAPRVIHFTPTGRVLDQAEVRRWSDAAEGAVLLCGRYEGIDQRFIDRHVTHQVSIGDFVLSGGEVAAWSR